MIKIVSDSSCNIRTLENLKNKENIKNIENIENIDFVTVPMTFYTDERTFIDDENLNLTEMLDYLAAYKDRSYTSCPNVDAWFQAYQGGDEIYVVTLTSNLSGTYNAAMAAKEMYLQEKADAKVEVFDTLSTGPEMHLVIEKIQELVQAGKPFEEVCAQVHQYMKKTCLFFALGSLHNLAMNGRVNKVLASAIGTFGVKVIAKASEVGDIKSISKGRGEKKAASKLYDELCKAGYKGGRMRVCHIECESIAEIFTNLVKAQYPDVDIQYYISTGLCGYYAERGGLMVGAELD